MSGAANNSIAAQMEALAKVVSDVALETPSPKWRVWWTDKVIAEFETSADATEYVKKSNLLLFLTGPSAPDGENG